MPMESNRGKFSSGPRKRPGGFKSENNPSAVAILNMAVDSRSLFHRSAPRLSPDACGTLHRETVPDASRTGILALTDELTGLYNRRGFTARTEHQLPVWPGN
jgi:hypothetical protein